MSNSNLWGARFSAAPNELANSYCATILIEQRLIPYDIAASCAHVSMLGACNIISMQEMQEITKGLKSILSEYERGEFKLDVKDEDIHMAIERRLGELIGSAAGKLHTARSRNDQIACDERLYLKDVLKHTLNLLHELNEQILKLAKRYPSTILPGHTHLQIAQPVLFAHRIMAFFWMFKRDYERFASQLERLDECPLGAAALAGTSFNINRAQTATALGFERASANSIDSVSDRDFWLEYASCAAICASHLSRLCEELIIFNSAEFNYIELSDEFCTGSSIMPQKKNPDVCEKMRGKTGRIYGALQALLVMMKGLPLAYNTDMSDDKASAFMIIDELLSSLEVLSLMLAGLKVNESRCYEAAALGFSNATDLADFLASKKVAFRTAHEIVGKIVAAAIKDNCSIEQLSLEKMRQAAASVDETAAKLLDESVYERINLHACVQAKASYGGTSHSAVSKQLELAQEWLKTKISQSTSIF